MDDVSSIKDNFSFASGDYRKFRPQYPAGMFQFIYGLTHDHQCAWDCGTGNGQVASALAEYFNEVMATDISENQLNHAIRKPNIYYLKESAEKTSFPEHHFDLITVAQAIHWFQFDRFYAEVIRTLKPDGIFAVIGYPISRIDETIDPLISKFYNGVLGKYWDPERRYIDDNYQTIPFPFDEIKSPEFVMTYEWTANDLLGFLNTWSAVHHYSGKHKENPVESFAGELKKVWKEDEKKEVTFPVLLRIAKKRI